MSFYSPKESDFEYAEFLKFNLRKRLEGLFKCRKISPLAAFLLNQKEFLSRL